MLAHDPPLVLSLRCDVAVNTGSPFMVKVTGEGTGRMTEKILRHQDAADVAEVGSECELSLKIPRQ